MKLRFATILCAFAAIFSMASCTEEILGVGELPPLAGEVVLTDVVDAGAVRLSPNYVFTLELQNAAGDVFEAKFASASTALTAGTYTEASPAYAVAGNFITGAEGTKLTVGGETHLVTAGTIKVAEDAGSYSLEAIVKLDNGTNYSLTWAGRPVSWGEVLVATKLNTVMHTQVNQNKTITVKLADAGVEFTASQYGPQVTGGKGNYLSVDFYSEDEYLAAGTYTPAANPAAPSKGEYVPGYVYEQVWGDQVYASNYGTNWFTVDATATPMESCEHVTTGNITVSITDGVYTITVDNNEIYAQYVGEIADLLAPSTPPVLLGDYPYLAGVTDQYEQYKSVVLQFTSVKDLATVGNGKMFTLTINAVKEGDALYIPTGKYDVNQDGAENPFTWQATGGMDLSEWGMGYMYWGSYFSDVKNGESTVTELKDGTVWIGAKGGDYIIHMNAMGKDHFIYQGKIKGLTTPADDDGGYVAPEPEEGEGEDGEGGACGCDCDGCKDCTGGGDSSEEDSFNGTMLVGLGGWMDYSTMGMNMIGIDLYSEGCTVSMSWWQYTYTGTGKHLKLEIYAEGGVITPGVYEVSTTLEAGKVNAGSASGGTELFDVVDGKATSAGKITDGTVIIEQNGDTYTLTIESSLITARYVGPLAAPAQ